ncbi:hypothetical protein D3C76_1778520 [compost metagenome]
MLEHLVTEVRYHFGIIIRTSHPRIAKLHEIFKAELLRNFRSYFHQIIVDAVKRFLMFCHKSAGGFHSTFAHIPIGRLLKRNQMS